jgi:hypothetical protein
MKISPIQNLSGFVSSCEKKTTGPTLGAGVGEEAYTKARRSPRRRLGSEPRQPATIVRTEEMIASPRRKVPKREEWAGCLMNRPAHLGKGQPTESLLDYSARRTQIVRVAVLVVVNICRL